MTKTARGSGVRSCDNSLPHGCTPTPHPRYCADCKVVALRPRQSLRCERCRDRFNARESRRRALERRLFGHGAPPDAFVDRAVDVADLQQRRQEINRERVVLFGRVEVDSEIGFCVLDDMTRHVPQHVLPRRLRP
jgi:hypothetical protein